MRILSVRGQNLASLSERFEIDLTTPPLAGTGIFAITGHMGAGKSTILDALCLGLYGAYPRAATEGREKVFDPGNEEIQAGDPRNILRRGASEGFAEVDFIGQDGIEYRATWAVRRARGKASGKLQSVERRLDRRDGSANVAAGIRDVETAVVDLTGLTYDQFRRTVLLAQGEFDTFLLASDKERAELLEKITGTGIYARISRQVHAGKDERDRLLRERQSVSAAMETLSDADRARLVAEVEGKRQKLTALDAAIQVLTQKRNRSDLVAKARESLAKAEASLAEAEAIWQSALEKRDQLKALQAVDPLRAKLEALSRANDNFNRAVVTLRLAREAREKAQEARAVLKAEVEEASAAADAARSDVERFSPLWSEAAILDTQIATALQELESADRVLAEARQRLAEAESAHNSQTAAREDLIQKRISAQTAIAARASHETLHVNKERLAEAFAAHNRLSIDHATASDQYEKTQSALKAQDERRQAAALEIEAAEAEIEKFETERSKKTAALEAIPFEAAVARSEALTQLDLELHRAHEAARKRDHSLAHHAAAVKARDAAIAVRDDVEAKLLEYRSAHEVARLKREGIAHIADLAEATASQHAQALRADLVADEPCPVCGAREHPYASGAVGADELVATVRQQRAELDATLASTQKDIAAAEGARAKADAEQQAAASRAADASRRLDEAMAELGHLLTMIARDAGPAQIEVDALTGTAGADAPIEVYPATIAEVELARTETTRLRQSANTLRRECDILQDKLRGLEAKTKSAREGVREADQNLSDLRARSAGLDAERRSLESQLGVQRTMLTPYLAAAGLTTDDLICDSHSALRYVSKLAADYAALVADRDKIGIEITAAENVLRTASEALNGAKSKVTDCLTQQARRRDRHEGLKQQRAALLDGEATDKHKAQFEAARDKADKAKSEAVEKRQVVELEIVKFVEAVASASAKQSETQLAVTEANETFTAALQEAGFDEAVARDLLTVSNDTRASLTQQVGALETALRNATTKLETWRAHLEGLAPVEGEGSAEVIAELRQEFEKLSGEKDALHGSLGAARDRLAQDDDRKKQLADVLREIEALKTDLSSWQDVHDAIGSSDGAKFRSYVQGITLRHLVGLANQQLALLNPRYQLRQAGTSPLALEVIDREMGDEIRAPRSLSGGERFLVSLALALALSGLEGRQSFVDSLFIDEGFGSLDRDTLDVAIDALESLQGQGRKVGLITHVQAMIERIAVQVRVEKRGGGRSVIRISNSTPQQNDSVGPLAHNADGAVA
ncbi:MAG: AAA family ATPase [Hyphomicrobium sp.]|nr:AAA family ATPase [Hyphomicrobium sp.]